MNVVTREEPGEFQDGLIQLRFSDDEGKIKDLSAAEMAEALQGLVSFSSEMAKSGLFGHGMAPEVRVRPPKEGSFIIEALVMWAGENPEAAMGTAVTAGGAIVQALNVGVRKLRGSEIEDFEVLDDGQFVKVKWQNGPAQQIPRPVWDKLQRMKRPTRKALRQLMAPLGDDVDRLEIRDGSPVATTQDVLATDPDIVASRDDYRIANAEPDEVEEETTVFETEAQLTTLDFRPGEKWRISTPEGTRRASIEDVDFLRKIDNGLAIHKTDILDVEISEVKTTKNGRTKREWSIINVIRKRPGANHDDHEPPATPSAS